MKGNPKNLLSGSALIVLFGFLLACGDQLTTEPLKPAAAITTVPLQPTATTALLSPSLATVMDYNTLLSKLQAAGATVKPNGDVSQPFFAVKGQVINLNQQDVQVFEYANNTAADAVAAGVSPDGYTIKTPTGGVSAVSWVAPPHFYKVDKLIVLYLGDSTVVISVLQKTLGNQFAGR